MDTSKQAVRLGALVICALIAIFLWVRACRPPAEPTLDMLREGLAWGAVHWVDQMEGGPHRVAAYGQEGAVRMSPSPDTLKAFARLARQQDHTLADARPLNLDDLSWDGDVPVLDGAALVNAVEQAGGADAVVSFLGMPHLRTGDDALLRKRSFKLLVVATEAGQLQQMLDAGWMDAAIVFADQPADLRDRGLHAEACFHRYFVLLQPTVTP